MERILFLMRYPLDEGYNLKQKFMGQMRACVNLGYDVYHIGYDSKHYYLCSVNNGSRRIIGNTHLHNSKRYRNFIAFFDLYSSLAVVLDNEQFDYIYMRKKLVTTRAVSTLRKYKRNGGKLIVEIPTYGSKESSLGFLRTIANRFFAKSELEFEHLVDLYTLIGNKCPNQYKSKPAIEIVNGISLDTIPIKKKPQLDSEIHMLAVASMRDWHGFDRIIDGMSSYLGDERLVLHLIGQDFDGSVGRWLKLATELGVATNVHYHGPLYDEKLTDMFDQCHIAIGSMAFHRMGISIGSALKVREYMARGIPFIYAYDDSILTGNEWFAIKYPSDDSGIDFNQVVPWIRSIYSRPDAIDEIRRFACQYLSWETQFKPIFMKMRELYDE